MVDAITIVMVIVGFGLVAVATAWLGVGSQPLFQGLFSMPGRNDWPHGVQEQDAPHFALEHADGLRSDPLVDSELAGRAGSGAVEDATERGPEVIEIYSRRLGPDR